jgi:hypothetical protein
MIDWGGRSSVATAQSHASAADPNSVSQVEGYLRHLSSPWSVADTPISTLAYSALFPSLREEGIFLIFASAITTEHYLD